MPEEARFIQVFTDLKSVELVAVKQQWASPVAELIEELNKLGEPVTFLGDGVPVFRSMIEEKLAGTLFLCACTCE